MPNLTQLITRQSGLAFWYPLTNDAASAANIQDESGNNRDMDAIVPGVDRPVVTLDVLNGQKGVVHNNHTAFFQYVGALSIRDIYMVAKVDDTPDFDDPFRGLLSGVDDTNFPVLVGKGSTTRWLNNAEGAPSMGWLLDDALQAEGARTAPFDAFRRIRVSTSGAALALDGLSVGQDREHVDRLFKGKWTDLMGWTTQRTAGEDRAIALYQDLKFNLWRTNGTSLNFPDPAMTGINYRHFNALPKKWDETVVKHEYADLGISTNEITDDPPQEWVLEMDCADSTHTLAKTQYDIFDSFWDAVRTSRPFNFTDKYGTTHTNVFIKDYSRSHSAHKSWKAEVAFKICKYP